MIVTYSDGRMTVDGAEHRSDLKIIGDRVIAHWWREKGHRLGTNDIKDIMSARPEVVVIGTGYAGNMRVEASLRAMLESHQIQMVAQTTHEAVKTFNKLFSEGKEVAGAFHLTC